MHKVNFKDSTYFEVDKEDAEKLIAFRYDYSRNVEASRKIRLYYLLPGLLVTALLDNFQCRVMTFVIKIILTIDLTPKGGDRLHFDGCLYMPSCSQDSESLVCVLSERKERELRNSRVYINTDTRKSGSTFQFLLFLQCNQK